jgi:hypothetical protein
MSRWGVSGAQVLPDLPYAVDVTSACSAVRNGFPACFAYAIAWRETIREYGADAAGRLQDGWETLPANEVGHGLFQLTASYPTSWADPIANTKWAIAHFLLPDVAFMLDQGPALSGLTLVKLVAAAFNAGPGRAWQAHLEGDVDLATTNGYAADVASIYSQLIAGVHPR